MLFELPLSLTRVLASISLDGGSTRGPMVHGAESYMGKGELRHTIEDSHYSPFCQ